VLYRTAYASRHALRTAAVLKSAAYLSRSVSLDKPGLFIDCGSNLGQGFSYFAKFYKPSKYDYILVEPNPACIPTLSAVAARLDPSNRAMILNKAAACENGTALFYGLSPQEGGPLSEGASTVPNHNTRHYTPSKSAAVKVTTFSLADFIITQSLRYPVIVLKLDVEGAEYQILRHLIATNAVRLLSHLYVEFHAEDVASPLREQLLAQQADILSTLKTLHIPCTLWT
jgi:FkbM family methyltransferase